MDLVHAYRVVACVLGSFGQSSSHPPGDVDKADCVDWYLAEVGPLPLAHPSLV